MIIYFDFFHDFVILILHTYKTHSCNNITTRNKGKQQKKWDRKYAHENFGREKNSKFQLNVDYGGKRVGVKNKYTMMESVEHEVTEEVIAGILTI